MHSLHYSVAVQPDPAAGGQHRGGGQPAEERLQHLPRVAPGQPHGEERAGGAEHNEHEVKRNSAR